MKKLFMIIIICMGLVGCGSKEVETIKEETTKTKETESISIVEEENIENPDFRNTKWDMTIDEVKKIENVEFMEENNLLSFNGEVAGLSSLILYEFDDNKLIRGLYSFKEEHVNKNQYYEDYKKLEKIYTDIYGEPTNSDTVWYDDLYQDDMNDIGMAISAGHVTIFSKWKTETTEITLIITGDNFEISLMAGYDKIGYTREENTDGI